jgi:hypothetical protein
MDNSKSKNVRIKKNEPRGWRKGIGSSIIRKIIL